jgi:hypothetical protein
MNDPFMETMFNSNMLHFSEMMNRMAERHHLLRHSGFRSKGENKEMVLIDEKISVCNETLLKLRKHPPSNHYEAVAIINKLTEYANSKDGTIKS